MPALLLRKALKAARPGAEIEAEATDPLAEVDLAFAAHQAGAQVLSLTSDAGLVRIRVRVPTLQ
jgi:TusA-related sulfurtransferase